MKINFILKYSVFVFSLSLLSCTGDKDLTPEQFSGMTLKQKLTGDEAKEFVNTLHFNPVTDANNEVGFYESPVGKAIIYFTYYQSNTEAENNFLKMTNKISPENSVFFNSSFIAHNEVNIYRTYGLGQVHYVFTKRNILFWLSADLNLGERILKNYIDYIQ